MSSNKKLPPSESGIFLPICFYHTYLTIKNDKYLYIFITYSLDLLLIFNTILSRAKLDLTCGFTQKEIATGFKHLIEKVKYNPEILP